MKTELTPVTVEEYVVHLNYGPPKKVWSYENNTYVWDRLHLVRCPDGCGKLLADSEIGEYLLGKCWRYAK